MSVSKDYEVIAVQAIDDTTVRLGIAPVGRIAQYSQQAGDPGTRGTVHFDMQIDWPAASQPAVGAVITGSFQAGSA